MGLYFGLRHPGTPTPDGGKIPAHASTATQPRAAASAPSPAPPPPPTSIPPPATPPVIGAELETKIRAAAAKALEAERVTTFVPKCWAPLVKKEPTPATSRYTFQFTFDENGTEVARGISEFRDQPSRFDVAKCLREQPMKLQLGFAPGARMMLDLPIEFP